MAIGKIFAGIMMATLLAAALQPLAAADGIPFTTVELHSTLRENRQIAYVAVDGNALSETLDLYLSVVSLDPGNDLTVMIPLRTKPYSVSGTEISESQFRLDRNYYNLMKLAEKQNHALEEVGRQAADSAEFLGRCQLTGIMGLMVIGMGSDMGGIEYPIADGVSMELLSFNSTDSLAGFYASQGVDVPDDVEDMINRYGDFHVGLLHAKTLPPIEQAKFDPISQNCPVQLNQLREYVAENPTITGYDYYGGYMEYYGNDELSSILNSIPDYTLRYMFSELISATYGQGTTQGTVISFHLPLPDRTAFFPLGTTPAWNGVHLTQVIFDIDESMMIDFNKDGDEVFSAGRHYYVWDFGAASPDYDLEGRVKAASLGTDLNRAGREAEQYLYERSEGLGIVLSIMIYLSLWMLGLWAFTRLRKWEPAGKRRFFELLAVAAIGMLSSAVLTVFIGVWIAVAFMAVLEHRYLPPGERLFMFRKPQRALAVALGLMLALTAFFCSAGFAFIEDVETSLPLLIGFFGVVSVFIASLAIPKRDFEMRLGAWFLYLAMMAPSFFMVVSNAGAMEYCTLAFVAFLIIQTALYIQLIRMDEGEPEPERVRWWGEDAL